MKTNTMNFILLLALALLSLNCKDDKDGGTDGGMTGNEMTCDSTLRPIILVHGFLASGDTYELQLQRFASNGYCNQNLYAFDWNTLAFGSDATTELDAFIDDVLNATGFAQVDLAGHSAGSGTCYSYLGTAERATKVAHYVHLAGNPTDGPAGPNGEVPTMNIWSTEDLVVQGGDIPDAVNEMQTDKDHYEVATSVPTFELMHAFFNDGNSPSTTEITPETDIRVSGRVVSFGENIPMEGATINIYEVSPADGSRIVDTPEASATSDVNGDYGPVALRGSINYEFEVIPSDGSRKVHYFREAFVRSSELVYLRTIPTGGLGGVLLGSLPSDDNQTVLAFYSGSKAVINGRDVLSVDGNVLSTPEFTAPENSTIAMFYYDGNDNQTSDLTDIGGSWALVPTFLAAVDMYIPTSSPSSVTIDLNGKTITVPNLKSETDGVIVAQFY